jgi:dipeptidyl aminopeptidase/acylaminoacyl peptidase
VIGTRDADRVAATIAQVTQSPYGTWSSPVSPAMLVTAAVGLSDLTIDGGRLYWIESRPAEAGRQVLVSAPADGGSPPADLTPAGFSVRTAVHEYGGRCYCVREGMIAFSNWADQRLWLSRDGADPIPLTPEPAAPGSVRFADPVFSPDGTWVVAVRETHEASGTVLNDLVAVRLDSPGQEPRQLAGGHDFFAAPRFSPDGTRLCWVTWELPEMPWDSTRLWCAGAGAGLALAEPALIAGGPGESVTQPRWSPDGVLHYISDRTGWWNLYAAPSQPLCPLDAEFGEPDWVFGNATYGFTPDGELVATWRASIGEQGRGEQGRGEQGRGEQGHGRQIGVIRNGHAEPRCAEFSSCTSLQVTAGPAVYAIAASPVLPPAVVRLDLAAGGVQTIRRSREVPLDQADISRPQSIDFPTGGGQTAHALFYPPTHATLTAPPGERPPVIVIIHGGPTSSASATFSLSVQYWTNRGFAVADVNYRGSSGYGRSYRQLLAGQWGIADVEDCAAVVRWLDERGLVDGRRAVIRGGSAGGFTTLAALAFTRTFSAGASHYGVADLELLARDTHKFESRYLDGLVGPWPEAAAEYQRRSPIHHVDQITSPLILFQGLDDRVVPPEQAELMYHALRDQGVPVAYLTFAGEQHGFRRAETLITVMTAELEFYGRVFGFTPALPDGEQVELTIANDARLA